MDDNVKEVMEYHGYKGRIGKIGFYVYFFFNWLKYFLAMKMPVPSIRAFLQRSRGVKMGKNVYVGEDVIIDLLYPDQVIIEDDVDIGDRSLIYAHSRGSPPLKRLYPRTIKRVIIKKGSWIGNNVMILPGVKIGPFSVVGGSSVVTRDIPPYSVAVGAPARVIRKINKDLVDNK
ncbi:MAG: acyltransferase [Promethearchaeota archaeon]